MNPNPEMLDLVKALSDADRLRIIGLLTRQPANRAAVCEKLSLPAREAADHLAFLAQVGVITQKGDLYELNAERMATLGRDNLSHERRVYVPAPDLDENTRKVLKACLAPDGSIRQIPAQPRLKVILNYLLQAFAPGVNYSEREVNQIIRRFHEDTAGLRRDLVDSGLLARESDGSRYWRPQ